MKNLSIGTGLAILGLCVVSPSILDRIAPTAHAGTAATSAIVAAATTQVPPEPTIVWYSWSTNNDNYWYILVRAWSDGKVEMKRIDGRASVNGWCSTNPPPNDPCSGNWIVVSSTSQGYNASADINFDSKVDGADLGQVLAMWGDAPRQDIPPSTCPLNLINP
jgi:hypothetical protein